MTIRGDFYFWVNVLIATLLGIAGVRFFFPATELGMVVLFFEPWLALTIIAGVIAHLSDYYQR